MYISVLLVVSFLLAFSPKTLYTFLFCMRATCPAYLILHTWSLIIFSAVFSNIILFYPSSVQIFSSTSCSEILCLCSSLNVTDQVSHPYSSTHKLIILYILISAFLDSRWKDVLTTIPKKKGIGLLKGLYLLFMISVRKAVDTRT
jgi:hypothetical protein